MPKRVNPMLASIEARHQVDIARQRSFTLQQCCDMMLIAANAAFGFGPDRLFKLQETYQDVFREYAELAVSDSRDDPDIVYTRAKVDGKLQQILGDKFTPWEERYRWTT